MRRWRVLRVVALQVYGLRRDFLTFHRPGSRRGTPVACRVPRLRTRALLLEFIAEIDRPTYTFKEAMRLYPFHGICFSGADAGSLAAPPYDQIDDSLRDRLHRDPHQFAQLSRPITGEDANPYQHAAHLHQEWLAEGVIREDAGAALYPYEILLPSGGRRLGITAMVGIEPPETRVIRPHEHTLAKAVADRLELIRAMRVDLEPILLLADDAGAIERLLEEDVARSEPFVVHEDANGNRHRLFRLTAPARVAGYVEAVRDRTGLIADGHHRYKVAGLFAQEIGAELGSAAAAKLTVLTSLQSPELRIDPIHRGLRFSPDLTAVRALARRVEGWEDGDGAAFASAVALAPRPALGVWPADGRPEVWTFDPERPLFGLPLPLTRLAVTLLHRGIFPQIGLNEDADIDGTVVYRSDPEALVDAVSQGQLSTAFFLPPMEPEAFAEAVADGGMLPPKSTRFLPKVTSGLVWVQHATPLG